MEKPVNVPEYICKCPVYFDWTVYKGETYFGMLNYERSIKARRPMIDLAYCATRGLNGTVLKTVAYSKKHFSKIQTCNQPMKITQVYYHQGKFLMLHEDKWPQQHEYRDKFDQPHEDDYLKALTSALSKAVPFEDQESIKGLVIIHNFGDYDVKRAIDGQSVDHLFESMVYGIPETEVEIVLQQATSTGKDGKYLDSDPESIKQYPGFISKRVARIKG